jgi:Bacterial regulatory proteins, luxR family
LNISVKTVESHRAQLMNRLNIHDIASLVRYAIRMCLVSLDTPSVRKTCEKINLILTLSGLLFSWPELQVFSPLEIP